jgi:hypothetical protein
MDSFGHLGGIHFEIKFIWISFRCLLLQNFNIIFSFVMMLGQDSHEGAQESHEGRGLPLLSQYNLYVFLKIQISFLLKVEIFLCV